MSIKHKCGDCGREEGENHLDCCDIERCPKCSGQLLSCDCNFPQMTVDEKGKEFKRILIKSSLEEDFGY